MAFERVPAAVRALVLAVSGGIATGAWIHGLYATALLSGLVGIWTGAQAVLTVRAPTPPPPAPTAPADEEEKRRLSAYLDFSPAPLVTLDGGRLRAVNRAARRLLAAQNVVPNAPAALIAALDTTVPGRTATIEMSDGDATRNFALTASDLSLGGRTTRIGALIDIDAELKAAEATALRELVQVLSHEIVNALTPIASLAQTAADMLNDRGPTLPEVREAVETVARRADGLRRFGESYRALARLPAPARRRVAVGPFIADLERLFVTHWPAIAFAIDAGRAPAYLHGDPDQLSAALWAVMQNAAEALQAAVQPSVRLRVATLVGATAIEITDNGPGIPAGDAELVFRPFFTTKAEGTGIGLALARQILRGHGGDLTLERGDSGSTSFRATLPDDR